MPVIQSTLKKIFAKSIKLDVQRPEKGQIPLEKIMIVAKLRSLTMLFKAAVHII